MNSIAKRFAKSLAIFLLISLNVSVGLYVVANILDWRIDVLNINPSDHQSFLTFPPLGYPPQHGVGLANGSIFFQLKLFYNGVLAEDTPVNVSALGACEPDLFRTVRSVDVYFEGAMIYNIDTTSDLYFGNGGVTLYPTDLTFSDMFFAPPGEYFSGSPQMISWKVQGDYYPIIEIWFLNGTEVVQPYQDFRIHVSAIDVVQQARYGRVNTALSISLVLFAFVESFVFVWHQIAKKGSVETNDSGKDQTTNTIKSETPKQQPKQPEIKKQKQDTC